MSCLAGAILSPLLVDVGDTVHFIASHTVLVATGLPVLGSARAESFEGLSAWGWIVPCTNFRRKGPWQSGFEFVTCSGCAS